jgi:3-hydroxyacyl-CoA dehydrogenase
MALRIMLIKQPVEVNIELYAKQNVILRCSQSKIPMNEMARKTRAEMQVSIDPSMPPLASMIHE